MSSQPRWLAWPVLLAALIAAPVAAHGPTPQKVDEVIEIAAPPAAVWSIIQNFDAMADWRVARKESAAAWKLWLLAWC